MKIFAPLNYGFDIEKLCQLADEFYVGVVDEEWETSYSKFIGYNTRGFSGIKANFPNWESLSESIQIVRKYNKEVFLTVNSHNISNNQINNFEKIISKFSQIGGHGIICSELNGVIIGKKLGLKVYLSTNFSLYSSSSIEFIDNLYNIDRIILPRDMKFNEISKIRNNVNKEIEVFGQNFGCRFSNGLCYCTHNTKAKGMCYSSMVSKWNYFNITNNLSFKEQYSADINHYIYSKYLLNNACSLCAIYDFINIGIDSIKIVGRELPYEDVYNACKIMNKMIKIAESCQSKEEYINKLKNETVKKFDCYWGFQCYYPEISSKDMKEVE